MRWTFKNERLLEIGVNVFSATALLSWFWTMAIWFHYADVLPTTPNASSGNIYPLGIHEVVVYQTLKQRSRLDNWQYWSWGIGILALALGVAGQWRKDRHAGARRSPAVGKDHQGGGSE